MSKYLIVESRDPFEFPDVRQLNGLAGELQGAGHDVTVYLLQNGVMAARAGAKGDGLAGGGVTMLADDYSLTERGIGTDGLAAGVAISNMDALVDLLMDGSPKIMWH